MKKGIVTVLMVCVLVVNCVGGAFAVSVDAVNIKDMKSKSTCFESVDMVMEGSTARATEQIDLNISAGSNVKNTTEYQLEKDEIVTINCTYSPKTAAIDFGLIAPDGVFYYMAGSDGSCRQSIQVDQSGAYHFAICNNSSTTVTVLGFVYY